MVQKWNIAEYKPKPHKAQLKERQEMQFVIK